MSTRSDSVPSSLFSTHAASDSPPSHRHRQTGPPSPVRLRQYPAPGGIIRHRIRQSKGYRCHAALSGGIRHHHSLWLPEISPSQQRLRHPVVSLNGSRWVTRNVTKRRHESVTENGPPNRLPHKVIRLRFVFRIWGRPPDPRRLSVRHVVAAGAMNPDGSVDPLDLHQGSRQPEGRSGPRATRGRPTPPARRGANRFSSRPGSSPPKSEDRIKSVV